jgi:hypothetical protein
LVFGGLRHQRIDERCERGLDLGSGRVSARSITFEQPEHDAESRSSSSGRRDLGIGWRLHEPERSLLEGRADEGEPAGEGFEEHDAERVEIGAHVDVGKSLDLLRRHVCGRTHRQTVREGS